MLVDMIMPQMGESIVEGTIVKWRKKSGEAVAKDEIILEISTDKVDSEIPSPADGILSEILADEGKTVAVGTVIARIRPITSTATTQKIESPQSVEQMTADEGGGTSTKGTNQEPLQTLSKTAVFSSELRSKRFLSPLVKKIAAEHGLTSNDIENIAGTGARGRITKNDILAFLHNRAKMVEAAVAESTPSPATIPVSRPPVMPTTAETADVEIIPMDHIRKRIAEHMVMSKHTSAHVTTVAEADMTAIVRYRESIKHSFERQHGFPLTYTAFFIDAAARALREFPLLNASVDQDRIIVKKHINIGIAVGLEAGLIVPVVRHADQLNLTGIARVVADLANRARTKQLKPEEVQGGTFSITNIGTYGNLFGTPIINQPQVAILGTGAIKKRPVIIDDAIAIRSMMFLSLTYDHRIIDGLYAGRFLQRLVEILEHFSMT